jgi:hypothetical protein
MKKPKLYEYDPVIYPRMLWVGQQIVLKIAVENKSKQPPRNAEAALIMENNLETIFNRGQR